jgi:hypothetical protein
MRQGCQIGRNKKMEYKENNKISPFILFMYRLTMLQYLKPEGVMAAICEE